MNKDQTASQLAARKKLSDRPRLTPARAMAEVARLSQTRRRRRKRLRLAALQVAPRRAAAALVLGLFVSALVLGVAALSHPVTKEASKAPRRMAVAAAHVDRALPPFDIVLDGTSPDQNAEQPETPSKTAEADVPNDPRGAIARTVAHPMAADAGGEAAEGDVGRAAPPILRVAVAELDDNASEDQIAAAHYRKKAQAYETRRAWKSALRLVHRAAELDPDNLGYRLELATLYDRARSWRGALDLYRQVLAAFDEGEGLPGVDQAAIAARATYLENRLSGHDRIAAR